MRILSYSLLLLMFLTGCSSSVSTVSSEEAVRTRNLIETGNFEITMNWANPMVSNELSQLNNSELLPLDSRAGQINLVGTTNFIRKTGDSLEVYLPYYGTRQLGASMTDTNGAIEFEGIPESYKFEYNQAKAQSSIQFKIDEGNERYDVYVTVNANKRAMVRVNSSQRTSIGYRGQVSALEDLK